MKSVSRRFLVCFRPVEMESGEFDSNDGVFEYREVKNKEEEGLDVPPKRSSRRFSKALKSVLFETSLSKSFRSGSSAGKVPNQSEIINSNSPLSSGSFSSSRQNPTGATQKPPPPAKIGGRDAIDSAPRFNSGICMLLVSLVLTVFWGRLFAIAFMLIWLSIFPHLSGVSRRPEKADKRPEMVESWDYKKRVIMEGLLERNHHHKLQ